MKMWYGVNWVKMGQISVLYVDACGKLLDQLRNDQLLLNCIASRMPQVYISVIPAQGKSVHSDLHPPH
jgi:hypothetical protein